MRRFRDGAAGFAGPLARARRRHRDPVGRGAADRSRAARATGARSRRTPGAGVPRQCARGRAAGQPAGARHRSATPARGRLDGARTYRRRAGPPAGRAGRGAIVMERVDVTILGRDYSLACSAEEKPVLMAAVRHVDQLMLRIQGSGKVSSNERIAVMAALQVAGELLAMKAPDGPLGGLAVGDFKRRIEEMNLMLDDALSGQEKLL
ncbi:cell division protein ZapA [Bordetella bronchiseptica SO10328]|nr:cell division protein ZapA [Bordetella bronchiseptica SO10328]